MNLTIEEKTAYNYVIAANDKYFDIVGKLLESKRNSTDYECLESDLKRVHKDFSIAALMVDELLPYIKDKRRRMVFAQLRDCIDNEVHQDIDRIQYKDVCELSCGEGTIEEFIDRFEEGINELEEDI